MFVKQDEHKRLFRVFKKVYWKSLFHQNENPVANK